VSVASIAEFANRLRKNVRHFRKWARRNGLEAFRVYDLDMPEFPVAVDLYGPHAHVIEYPRRRALREGSADQVREGVVEAIGEVLELPSERIWVKRHLPMKWGEEQYLRVGLPSERFAVAEQGLKFIVDLGAYLDTGLFLDHRVTRARVREEARGKRFLNLFCYTGAFTVYAAAGGARSTTSVDLSNTYLDWARENLELNGLDGAQHTLVRDDVLQWLAAAKGPFELAVVDPPPFSTSKKMERRFDVQRDHRGLIENVLRLLVPGGVLYFSTNYREFELKPQGIDASFEETTPRSIPEDFRQRDVHRCWRITK
jgi:23S rRNA (cytosine1962-C5)-methyltransferase